MKFDFSIFNNEAIRNMNADEKIRIECKLATGAMNDQSREHYNSLDAFLAYTSMNMEGKAIDRWFAFVTVKKGSKNAGSGKAYISFFTQESLYNAGKSLQEGNKLPALRLRQGHVTQGCYELIKCKQTFKDGSRGDILIPDCHTYDDVRRLCESLADEARFDLSKDAKAARGFELLTAMAIRQISGIKAAYHVGDFTTKDGDLYQGCDVVAKIGL